MSLNLRSRHVSNVLLSDSDLAVAQLPLERGQVLAVHNVHRRRRVPEKMGVEFC